GPRLDHDCRRICAIQLEGTISKLFALCVIGASKGTLRSGNVSFDCVRVLAHRLIKIGEANLNAEIVGFGEKQFFQEANRLRLAIVLQMNFRELEKEGARFTHYALLHVEISETF